MKKGLVGSLFFVLLLFISCEELELGPPKNNTDYIKIIGNPIKLDKFEVTQYDFPGKMNWFEAKNFIDSLGADWRLPNK